MALETEQLNNNDNEEDDFGCYFLQPAAAPYNIAEKVQQANNDLFGSSPQSTRSIRVKFKDELISFEPDLTDDDVNSIESDHVAEEIDLFQQNVEDGTEKEEKLLSHNVLRGGLGMYDIEEEVEGIPADDESIHSEDDNALENEEVQSLDSPSSQSEQDKERMNDSKEEESMKMNSDTVKISSRRKKPKFRKSCVKKFEVHCKDHCIEKLDGRLSMSIKKLEIHDKPPINLPPLQLRQRKCCDDIKTSNSDRNLPTYNGYRSEYGLSSRQLKNRNRYMEMLRQKEMARRRLIEEYRALKIQQNEEVFSQWLKEVTRRQQKEQEIMRSFYKNSSKTPIPASYQSPSVLNINKSSDKSGKLKERPKTAGFVPKTSIKKKRRPHTTQSCVYIEVPPDILKKGLNIGDLLITNSKELSKKLHILTIS